jgi:predicted membrane channel-forming protein YqfA (hemolysin III family)
LIGSERTGVVVEQQRRNRLNHGQWILEVVANVDTNSRRVRSRAAERVRYSHFVWHLCVLTGTGCHFFAVLLYAA